MESNSKRRKIEHANIGLRHEALIDFESRNAARISTASTFVLQTDELLKEARFDYGKALSNVDGQLHKLKSIIDSIKPHEPVPISKASSDLEKQHRITIPYPDPKPAKDAPYKVSFETPSQCNVVGSYVSRTMAKSQPEVSVDMVIQMPKSLFQEKDYMNMRYFYRRAYYIAYVSAHLRKELGESMALTFENLHGNPLLPVLVMRPLLPAPSGDAANGTSKKGPQKANYTIKLIPCAPEDLFPWSKTTPTSSNIKNGEASEKQGAAAPTPTPFYNSTLNAERTFISYLRLLSHTKKECPAFPDACILGRIWLQQRGFGSSIAQGGFGHFEWAVMIALLLQMGGRNDQAALSTSLSSTELFKAALRFLSTTDLNKKPFAFGSSKVAAGTGIEAIREAGPVMFDPVRQLNILAKMSPWSANMLQLYAKSSADLLSDESADKFDPTFITKADVPLQVFDVVFEIQSDVATGNAEAADRRGATWSLFLEAQKLLKRAYGNRAQIINVQLSPGETWPVSKHRPRSTASHALVGVIFDSVNMSRQMEHGPSAEEQKEAAKFRQFWGEKSELRRFKDGSILECVEWTSKFPLEICEEITHYILQRHLKISKDQISTIGRDFSSIIGFSPVDKLAFDSARQAFQNFERNIRDLEEMPLHIKQLSPISPMARYASMQPPAVGLYQGAAVELMEVNLYFEASSRWPENLVAIQEAKLEFLQDIDRRLRKAHDTITTSLGRENRALGIENLGFLDIIYEKGAAFRLRIHCDLENTLLQRQINNKTLEPRVRENYGEAYDRLTWAFTTLPLHTQTIATYCTRLHPLSQTIRLVKHWFNSHKLSGHISEELIELFALHAFLQPYPWRQPSSVMTGFLRTLFFLSKWDWRDEALIVDTAENLGEPERSAIRHELQSWRKRDPNMNRMALFVATSHDQTGLAYTRAGPSKLVAMRMTRLAKAACRIVRDEGINLDPSQLFEASLQDYDVLFHLSPKAVKGAIHAASVDAADDPDPSSGVYRQPRFKNLEAGLGRAPLPMRAHPVDVLAEELGRVYADTLIFFRGGAGDAVLAAIWNPSLQRHKFRPGLAFNFHAASGGAEEDKVQVNRDAVLLEIARIGGDLIKKIEVVDDEEGEEEK
ncbi:U3 small nucleolar RNA-associated protein 22 [Escovopsis weberi]|uniref:U3 small nucleolar RNA-associated protein 22 n=1 Tax=Escovopsis weberi TaxID=150374 RepID=A0A0M9VSU4_ESCWE|nr:U3 small nucleolar RNA-associated protein 22 [Escovopsis weberi]